MNAIDLADIAAFEAIHGTGYTYHDTGTGISWTTSRDSTLRPAERLSKSPSELDHLITWFQSNGGSIDTAALDLVTFPGQGRGAVALKHIPVSPHKFGVSR
jgi:hypothetical protein